MQAGPSRKEPPVLVSSTVSCELAEVLISRRLDGELDATDSLLLEAHLKCCENCRAHLESWSVQSEVLSKNLNGLWPVPAEKLSAPAQPPVPPRRSLWVPLGMMLSQFAAFIVLGIYIFFFATPARAPGNGRVSQRHTPNPPAEPAAPVAPKTQRAESPEPAVNDAVQVSAEESGSQASAPITPLPQAPAVAPMLPLPPQMSRQHDMASLGVPSDLKRIPNVSLEYEIPSTELTALEAGRVEILGDVLNGKAVIQLTDSSGEVCEIAQPDLDTLLSEPRRTVVKRFLAACARPDLRSRFEEILRRQK